MFSAIDGRFAAWITVAMILIVTPGPDTALIIRQALRGGARTASRSVAAESVFECAGASSE